MTGPADVPHYYVAGGGAHGATPGRCVRCHQPLEHKIHLRKPRTTPPERLERARRRSLERRARKARILRPDPRPPSRRTSAGGSSLQGRSRTAPTQEDHHAQ